MDWYKIKNILIFILVSLNIVLFAVFYRVNTQDKIIEEQMRDNVVTILSANNISIDQETIPESPQFFTGHYIERALSTNASFIEKVLGSSYTTSENTYQADDKTLSFSGNMIDFTDQSPDNPPGDFTEDNVEKYCLEEMKKLGINYKIYVYAGLNFSDNSVKAIFSPLIGNYEFFDSFISFDVTKDGISAMQGKNILLSKTVPSISTKVFDINSILLELCSNPAASSEQPNAIISIRLGLYIGGGEERYTNVLAIPAWQIAMQNGSIFYFDARNGNFIE